MDNTVLIGHYAKNIYYSGYDNELYELTSDNFSTIVGFAPKECPFKKDDDSKKYFDWKSENLPVFYFTYRNRRPDCSTNEVCATGYAMIDIDGKPGVKYVSNHQSVCKINYTGNGTHFIIHTNRFTSCLNYQQWQDVYNTIAFEIWTELCNNYKDDIKLDWHSSRYDWGCYLWNTEWESNPDYDREWEPDNIRYFDDKDGSKIIDEMYDGKYKRFEAGTYTSYSKKGNKKENFIDVGKAISQIAANNKRLSDRIVKDFKQLDYLEFIEKYEEKYPIITGSEIKFENYTDYKGNVYEMCKTDGKVVKLWMPYMQERGKDAKIKKGGRKNSLWAHIIRLCRLTSETLDPDCVLYNGVYFAYMYFEDGAKFDKLRLISTVTDALVNYWQVDIKMYTDKRMFISGPMKIVDKETGEMGYMNTAEKIGANHSCRKTERIIAAIKMWDPSKDFEWNADHIRSWNDDGGKKKKDENKKNKKKNPTDNTIKQYIKDAKNMPSLVSQYNWLKTIEFNSKGCKKQPISIMNLETNEVIEFNSKKECMECLGCSSRTFSKLLKDTSKQYKQFKLLNDSNDFKDSNN